MVIRQRDRAPQGDPVLGVATDDRILHVHPHVIGLQRGKQRQLHALLRQFRFQLAVEKNHLGQRRRNLFQVVELAIEQGEHARLRLFHHLDLDTADQRQPFAKKRSRDRVIGRVLAWRRMEHGSAKIRIGLQYNPVAVLPFRDGVRAGADRVTAGVARIRAHHFARHYACSGHRHLEQEVAVRLFQRDAQRIAVERGQAVYRHIGAELALALEPFVADDLVFKQK